MSDIHGGFQLKVDPALALGWAWLLFVVLVPGFGKPVGFVEHAIQNGLASGVRMFHIRASAI